MNRHCYLLIYTKVRNRTVKTEVARFEDPKTRLEFAQQYPKGEVQAVGSTSRLVIQALRDAKLGHEWPICVYGETNVKDKEIQRS